MIATVMTHADRLDSVVSCQSTVAEAAAKLGVSESAIRRAARRLGVRKISGPTVAGFVRFSSQPIDVVLPYSA